jgi:methionyl-tRNA synthetase
VLSFAYKHWDGHVPDPGELRPADLEIIATIEAGFQSVGEHLNDVRLRSALAECLRLATEVNRYQDTSAPWFEIKTDKSAAAKSVFTALKCIDSLKVLFSPFLPFSSEKLHTYFGYTEPLFGEQYTESRLDALGQHQVLRYRNGNAAGRWQPSLLVPGQKLSQPAHLFRKLDESIAEEERSRLGKRN